MATARTLLVLVSGFLCLESVSSLLPAFPSSPPFIRRATICRETRMSWEQGAGLSPLAHEAIQMGTVGVSLPALLVMLRGQRAQAAKSTGSRSCDAEHRRQAHRELKEAAMRSSSMACNVYFRIIHEDYGRSEMPRGDDHHRHDLHDLGAHEELEARRRGGLRTPLDALQTQTLRRRGPSSYAPRLSTQQEGPPGGGHHAGTITLRR